MYQYSKDATQLTAADMRYSVTRYTIRTSRVLKQRPEVHAKQTLTIYYEYEIITVMLFMDFKSAYNSDDRRKLLKVLN